MTDTNQGGDQGDAVPPSGSLGDSAEARQGQEAPPAASTAHGPGPDPDPALPRGTGAATVGTPVLLGLPLVRQAVSPAFDDHHPPDSALIGDCVHCGFCLPACPTYVLWGEEMDSPRGRIHQMKTALEGEPLDTAMVRHIDQCLGCMACVTACPSGVQYGKLIEATRPQIERRHERSRADKLYRGLIFRLFPYPRRLRVLRGPLRAYQAGRVGSLLARTGLLNRLPAPLQAMESLAPRLAKPPVIPERTPAAGERRAVVGLLAGCVQGTFFPDVNAATVRVLAAEGCDVVVPRRQGCCGALSAHGGREEQALDFARKTIETFERADVDAIVVNAAGCGSTIKEYAHQLRDEPAWAARAEALASRTRDITEFLAELGPVAERHPLPMTLAYQDACHLAHAQGVRSQPRSLLRGIPGVELRELDDAELCCGSAGTYNMLQPEPARELGERKAAAVLKSGAQLMVTANPGCWMQVATTLARMGTRMPVAHTVQVLDAAIRHVPVERFLEDALNGPGTALPRPTGST
ncbi:(Fe-S)-binding protein [Streptomyces sp. NPDC056716]|uniref:(Fe-S)-binding protein n=1 Tax=unclassified Streptomyces TaxID=2593676 RepID=UPI0036C7D19E